jgi:hypothetical protein
MIRIAISLSVYARITVLFCICIGYPARQAMAVLLAHEAFNYGANTELLGQTGGTGFASGWQAGPGNIGGAVGGTAGLSADNLSLTYPAGTLLSATGARFVAQPGVDDNDFVRLLSTTINMAADGVYYFSFLGNKSDLSTSSDYFIAGVHSNAPVDQFTSQFEARAAEIGWGSGDNILMATNPGGAYASSTLSGKQINKDMLLVLKIVSRAVGNDEVRGYIFSATAGDPFPDIVSNEPADNDWLLSRTMDSTETLDRIRIMSGNNNGAQLDEIRLGTTWADVVAPNPAAQPQTFTWNRTVAGDWNDASNWLPSGVVPNGNHEIVFGNSIVAPSTVYTDNNVTVRTMKFDSAVSYGIAGQGIVTLNKGTSAAATINVMQGSHEIQTSLNVTSPLTIQTATGAIVEINNSVSLGSNTVTISGSGTVNFNHIVTGSGSIASSATLGTAGATAINGNLTSTGTLAFDIFGSEPWSFDSFDVNGTATLSGMISVDVHDGYTPSGHFDILTAGVLNNQGVTLGGPDAGLFTLMVDTVNGIVRLSVGSGLTGDYNHDNVVNAADYVVWRKTLGQSGSGLAADGNGNNQVDPGDYQIWRSNFGNSGSGAAASQLETVPEPAMVSIIAIAALITVSERFRRTAA